MKRIALLLALCLILSCLTACHARQEAPASVTSFPPANFNNNYWFSGNFWVFDNSLFYMQDGFYNMGVYQRTHKSNTKLFEESDFSSELPNFVGIGDIFVCGSYLYFDLVTDTDNWLYRYDLKENTYAAVCKIPRMWRWVVVDDYFIYTEHPTNNEERRTPLHIYNIADGTTTEVCSDVEEFGIVDGQLRYITHADAYELFQYDYLESDSAILGTFYPELDITYNIFNFTADSVVMLNWNRDYDRNLVVYHLSSNSTAVYTLPKGIHNMVAYDQYAYAVVYDTQEYSSTAVPAKENGIYRINLADGSYEVIERKVNSSTEIHVVSDDCIYIIQLKLKMLFLAQNHVYKYDYITKDKDKLTVF